MSGVRQAALCIHGLNPRDQKWILKKLPREQRLTIKGMLRELNAIGIPADQEWLPQIEQKLQNERRDEAFDSETTASVNVIAAAPLLQIKKLLLAEPDEFIARLMSVRQWEWSEDLMAILSKQRKGRIDYLIQKYQERSAAPDLVKALLSVLAEEIKQSDGHLHK
ncbi:MAG: hypothetical protein PVG89_15490 [Gammaproteobacteria bacterium]|jgi:hypothetical protein